MSPLIIYVLALTNDKYYVGKSSAGMVTIHMINSKKTDFLEKNRPLRIVEEFEGESFDETKTVLKYMSIYGIDNVRGGPFTSTELNPVEKDMIQKMINSSHTKCSMCGMDNHHRNECPLGNRRFRTYPSRSEAARYFNFLKEKIENDIEYFPSKQLDNGSDEIYYLLTIDHLREKFYEDGNFGLYLHYVGKMLNFLGYCFVGKHHLFPDEIAFYKPKNRHECNQEC